MKKLELTNEELKLLESCLAGRIESMLFYGSHSEYNEARQHQKLQKKLLEEIEED
tara:strand:- start:1039 stop:1203 length:165 start_codon:yes stop_codon:yes gene_type:complete